MMTIQTLLAYFPDAKSRGDGWRARCPAHEDRQPSLSITEGDDGRILMHCHAGCSIERVCAKIGIQVADLFSTVRDVATAARPTRKRSGRLSCSEPTVPVRTYATLDEAEEAAARFVHGNPVGRWTYQNAQGDDQYVIVRLDVKEGKTFRPLHCVNGRWQMGDPDGPLPLYRLLELDQAQCVYVCEGEKAADAARAIGLVATTSAHGAMSPQKTDWSPLAGKEVVVVPDNDAAGHSYAQNVSDILTGLTPPARVQILDLPNLPDHGDIVDFLDARDAAEPDALRQQVEELVRNTQPYVVATRRNAVPPREPFPIAALPEPMQSFVIQGAAAIGCDPSYLALPLLAAAAGTIGNTRRIQLKQGWTEPSILWTAVVGESGTLKTPAFQSVMRPLYWHEAQLAAEYKVQIENYDRQLLEYDRAVAQYKRAKLPTSLPIKPELIHSSRFLVSDTTVEALAPLLLSNPRGLLLIRDELAGWIGSFDRYAQGKGADAAHWLSMHSGGHLLVDRKTGLQRMIFVPRAAVSITGGIQPGILFRALDSQHRESGLAARLLLSYPPRRAKQWTDAEIDPQLEASLEQLFAGLRELAPQIITESDYIPMALPLSDEARVAWVQYYNAHAREQVELLGELSAAWSKLEGYAARLALVIHCVRSVTGDPTLSSTGEIDAQSILAGVALSNWFGSEAKRVYALLNETDVDRDDRRLREWIEQRRGDATVREVQQGLRGYPTAETARDALNRLVRAGYGNWAPTATTGKSGRPSELFRLNYPVAPSTIDYETSGIPSLATVS